MVELTAGCGVQAQRHALVSITKVLQRAHAHVLSPEVQGGRTVQLAVSVLQHTAHSGVTSQAQWRAWCCRVLRDAASVDDKCTAKVRAAVCSRALSCSRCQNPVPPRSHASVTVTHV